MNILYNTQGEVTSKIRKHLTLLNENVNACYKPQLNFLPEVIYGMIMSESLVAHDVSLELKEEFSFVQLDSKIKRFHRLMRNKRFQGKILFNGLIKNIISNYKAKHTKNRIHIIIDHMYSSENYTILMASMRIGTQGIPIWYEVFDGINNSEAYLDSLLVRQIKEISNIFKSINAELIFLADRWFNSCQFLKTIEDLGHKYVIRLKGNINVQVYDEKEGHYIRKQTADLYAYQCHSVMYNNVILYEEEKLKTNIVRSKKEGVNEAWILATNGDYKSAIMDYNHRFGGIETIFKNQKSNGFYLEDIVNASIEYFENLYATLCIALTLIVCIGADYTKNSRCYREVKIRTLQSKNTRKRVMSVFKVGLTIFKMSVNSLKYIRLPLSFTLYDL